MQKQKIGEAQVVRLLRRCTHPPDCTKKVRYEEHWTQAAPGRASSENAPRRPALEALHPAAQLLVIAQGVLRLSRNHPTVRLLELPTKKRVPKKRYGEFSTSQVQVKSTDWNTGGDDGWGGFCYQACAQESGQECPAPILTMMVLVGDASFDPFPRKWK
jgi:hypothetical protein